MPRPYAPRRRGASTSSRSGDLPSHPGDSTPRRASGLRRGVTPSNSRSSSSAFTSPKFNPPQIPSVLDDSRRSVRNESPLVLHHSIPGPQVEQDRISAIQSEGTDALERSLEGHATDIGGESENEIVMAIDMREQHTIGCAYYEVSEEKLFLMQDCKFADLTLFDTRT